MSWAPRAKFLAWRDSARLGFILHIATRFASAALSLIWVKLLLEAMGSDTYGLFVTFSAVIALAGLADLGVGQAAGIMLARLIGEKDSIGAEALLADSRGLFASVALLAWSLLMVLAPFLAAGLGFSESADSGSLDALFRVGAFTVPLAIIGSYFSNVNHACANITWSILPTFLSSQIALLGHWILARQDAPLWVQYVPYLASSALNAWIHWRCIRATFPKFARIRPIAIRVSSWGRLVRNSVWCYFWSLAFVVYTASDRIIINAGFGASAVPEYHLNYKVCELLMWVITAAAVVSIPKIALWMASSATVGRAIEAADRLQRMQAFLSVAAACVYLLLNDWFITIWIGSQMKAPVTLQMAFAANLAVAGAGDGSSQVVVRSGDRGIRFAGIVVILTAALNVALSFLAMRANWLAGIAWATVISQSLFAAILAARAAASLGCSRCIWVSRASLLPLSLVTIAGLLRIPWSPAIPSEFSYLLISYSLLLAAALAALGMKKSFWFEELRALHSMFGQLKRD